MKLKTFDRSNSYGARSSEPTISLMKNGAISFSRGATKMIGLEVAGKVQFHQDEESPSDWYISKSDDVDGFDIRGKSENKNPYFMIASSFIVNKIKAQIGLDSVDTPIKMKILRKPTEVDGVVYWCIVTKAPIYKSE